MCCQQEVRRDISLQRLRKREEKIIRKDGKEERHQIPHFTVVFTVATLTFRLLFILIISHLHYVSSLAFLPTFLFPIYIYIII